MSTVNIFKDGAIVTVPNMLARMESACLEHAIDPAEMSAVALRLIEDEDARETFQEWTGLEVVLNN